MRHLATQLIVSAATGGRSFRLVRNQIRPASPANFLYDGRSECLRIAHSGRERECPGHRGVEGSASKGVQAKSAGQLGEVRPPSSDRVGHRHRTRRRPRRVAGRDGGATPMGVPHSLPGHGRDGADRPTSGQIRVGWPPHVVRRQVPHLQHRVSRHGAPRARPREGQAILLVPPRSAAVVLPSRHLPSAARGSSSPVCQSPLDGRGRTDPKSWIIDRSASRPE